MRHGEAGCTSARCGTLKGALSSHWSVLISRLLINECLQLVKYYHARGVYFDVLNKFHQEILLRSFSFNGWI